MPSTSPELPEEARRALRRKGDQLVQRLDAMREAEAAQQEIEALDPNAQLALRKSGDAFLASLDQERTQAVRAAQPRRRLWLGLGVAAAFFLMAGIAALRPGRSPEINPTIAQPAAAPPASLDIGEDGTAVSPNLLGADPVAVPEPSSALLVGMASALLLRRRRRPASSGGSRRVCK